MFDFCAGIWQYRERFCIDFTTYSGILSVDTEIFVDHQKITARLVGFRDVPLAEVAKLIERFEMEIIHEGGWQRRELLEQDLNTLRAYYNLTLQKFQMRRPLPLDLT